jgi:hypothetical protein
MTHNVFEKAFSVKTVTCLKDNGRQQHEKEKFGGKLKQLELVGG